MNRIIISGCLTRDPEQATTSTSVNYCKFGVAVNGKTKEADGSKHTDFFNCVAWRGTSDLVMKYCKKGQRVNVVGSMGSRSYQKQDGTKATIWELTVDEVEFVGGGEKHEEAQAQSRPQQATLTPINVDDDSLPF